MTGSLAQPLQAIQRLVLQENEPEEYINEISLDADEQAEPGPPPYESVMMSGYDVVGSVYIYRLKTMQM